MFLCVCGFSSMKHIHLGPGPGSKRLVLVPDECVSANFTLSDFSINPFCAALPLKVKSGANANAQTTDFKLIYLSLKYLAEL